MMKIILDSTSLERMIGGDQEFEIEIRNSVIQAFAKRHLKAIINDEWFQSFLKEETNQIKETCQQELMSLMWDVNKSPGAWGTTKSKLILKPELQLKLREEANLAVSREISKAMESTIKQAIEVMESRLKYISEQIDRNLDEKLKAITEVSVKAKIQNHILNIMKGIEIE